MLKMATPNVHQLHVLSTYLVESHYQRVKRRPILSVAISHRWAIKFNLHTNRFSASMPFSSHITQLIADDIGRSQKRVLREMCVACRYLGILVTEYPLYFIQRASRVHEKAGKAVPQIVQAYIL